MNARSMVVPWLACVLAITPPALAQQSVEAGQAEPTSPPKGQVVFDLEQAKKDSARDPVLDRKCKEEIDAGRIANEIVVCRDLGDATDGVFDKGDWERGYAERTQGPKAPNVDGSGLQRPTEGSVVTVTVTVKTGFPPPPPPLIDVTALPEALSEEEARQIGRVPKEEPPPK